MRNAGLNTFPFLAGQASLEFESLIHVCKTSKNIFSQEWKFWSQELTCRCWSVSDGGLRKSTIMSTFFLLHSTSGLLLVPTQVHPGALALIFQLPVILLKTHSSLQPQRSWNRDRIWLHLNWSIFWRWHSWWQVLGYEFVLQQKDIKETQFYQLHIWRLLLLKVVLTIKALCWVVWDPGFYAGDDSENN